MSTVQRVFLDTTIQIERVTGTRSRQAEIVRADRCTWYLGDLVIALEMPADAALYTTNQRHFAPLLRCWANSFIIRARL